MTVFNSFTVFRFARTLREVRKRVIVWFLPLRYRDNEISHRPTDVRIISDPRTSILPSFHVTGIYIYMFPGTTALLRGRSDYRSYRTHISSTECRAFIVSNVQAEKRIFKDSEITWQEIEIHLLHIK